MTKDHATLAAERIAKAQREADDTRLVIESVGTELSSQAEIVYHRIWHGTIGGLGYKLPASEVPALLDRLPPVPLEYRKRKPWAAHVEPAILPMPDDIETYCDCAPFFLRADCVQGHVSAHLVWYTASNQPGLMIRVHVELPDAAHWVQFYADPIKNGHGIVIGWRERIETKLHYASQVRAGRQPHSSYSDPVFSSLTCWWDDGRTLAEVLQP